MRMGKPSSPMQLLVRLLMMGTLHGIGAGCTLLPQDIESTKTQEGEMAAQAVRIDWRFTAPPDKVWAAWTEPDVVRRWFGSDPNGEVLATYLDVRPGGTFEVTFANADGTRYTATGVYQQVEPLRLLRFTWQWKNEPDLETVISIALSPDGTGTRMQFEHAGLIQLSSHDYASGWRSTFEKMTKAVASSL